jgi:hypothetical protein
LRNLSYLIRWKWSMKKAYLDSCSVEEGFAVQLVEVAVSTSLQAYLYNYNASKVHFFPVSTLFQQVWSRLWLVCAYAGRVFQQTFMVSAWWFSFRWFSSQQWLFLISTTKPLQMTKVYMKIFSLLSPSSSPSILHSPHKNLANSFLRIRSFH